ncbi:IS21 family transposase, partial [Halalkalibacter oceani]
KKAALSLLAVLLKEQDFDLPTEALRMASEHGHPTAESIKHVYYQLVNGRGIRETLSLPRLSQKLPMAEPASRGLTHYDQLFAMAGGEQS